MWWMKNKFRLQNEVIDGGQGEAAPAADPIEQELDFDLDGLVESDVEEGGIEEAPVAPTPDPIVPPATTTPPIEEGQPAPVVPPVVDPVVPPVADPVAVPLPVEAPAESVQPNAQQEADMTAYRTALENQYQLSDEEADALLTDPNSVIPKLAANLQMQVINTIMNLMPQIIPQQMAALEGQRKSQSELETAFSARWPDLSLADPEVSKVVESAVAVAKQQFPNASREVLIEKVGLLSHAMRGTIPSGSAAPAQAPVQAPVKPRPATPAVGNGQQRAVGSPAPDAWGAWIAELQDDE